MKISSDHYGMDHETNTDQGQDIEKKVKLLIKMPDLCVLKVVILRKKLVLINIQVGIVIN